MLMNHGSTVLLLRAMILILPAAITTTITSFTVQAFLDPPPDQQQHPLSSPLGNSFSIHLALPPLQTIASDSSSRNILVQHPHSSSSSSRCDQQRFLGVQGRKELPVLYTNDPHQVSSWLSEYIPTDGTNCFVGFDIESVPTKNDRSGQRRCLEFLGPSVVQLATMESAMVVHLSGPTRRSIRSNPVPQLLVDKVLFDPSIVKVGCGIDMDLVELRSVSNIVEARSRLDLGHACATSKQNTPGLKTLANEILGMDLPKDLRVVTSDWSQVPLSVEQITYAAYDAWAGVAIAHRLATFHPDTFGAAVLQDSLEHQLSIHELYSRRLVRKRARSILTAILEPHRQQSLSKSRKKAGQQPNLVAHDSPPPAAAAEPLPLWKSRLVKELNVILNANRHEVHAGIGRAVLLRDVRNQNHGVLKQPNIPVV